MVPIHRSAEHIAPVAIVRQDSRQIPKIIFPDDPPPYGLCHFNNLDESAMTKRENKQCGKIIINGLPTDLTILRDDLDNSDWIINPDRYGEVLQFFQKSGAESLKLDYVVNPDGTYGRGSSYEQDSYYLPEEKRIVVRVMAHEVPIDLLSWDIVFSYSIHAAASSQAAGNFLPEGSVDSQGQPFPTGAKPLDTTHVDQTYLNGLRRWYEFKYGAEPPLFYLDYLPTN